MNRQVHERILAPVDNQVVHQNRIGNDDFLASIRADGGVHQFYGRHLPLMFPHGNIVTYRKGLRQKDLQSACHICHVVLEGQGHAQSHGREKAEGAGHFESQLFHGQKKRQADDENIHQRGKKCQHPFVGNGTGHTENHALDQRPKEQPGCDLQNRKPETGAQFLPVDMQCHDNHLLCIVSCLHILTVSGSPGLFLIHSRRGLSEVLPLWPADVRCEVPSADPHPVCRHRTVFVSWGL